MDVTTLWVNAADIFTSVATFGALVALLIEIKHSRDAEKRSAGFELHDKWQQLSNEREVLAGLSWENMGDFFATRWVCNNNNPNAALTIRDAFLIW